VAGLPSDFPTATASRRINSKGYKEQIMKQLQFAVGFLATVASCGLYAQTINMRANIPFDFRMGEALMPAGEYFISHANGVLTLQERQGGNAAAVVLTSGTERREHSDKGVLQFNQYGNAYFLGEISTPDSNTARIVSKTPREKELARRSGPAQRTTVAAQTK
jgi:hypothetical protein